jgi:hypothetical protein
MRHTRICIGLIAASLLSLPAAAQDASSPSAQAPQNTTRSSNPAAITNLMQAAQRLRDATHDLVREPDAQKRNAIISQIDKTLLEVRSAMVSLPTNLLLAGVKESESKKAANEMAKAADRLHTAAAALGKADSAKSGRSVQDIQKALAEIQQERMRIATGGASQPGQQSDGHPSSEAH